MTFAKMSRYVGLYATFLLLLPSVLCEGYYTIVAPGTIRPNSEYHVAASIHQSSEPCSLKVGIISATYSNFQTVDLRPYSSKLIRFELPALPKDIYSLTAEGISGVEFTNETRLHFEEKQNSVLVQTDKAIYKPGDKVRYRVLVLDSNLRPIRTSQLPNVVVKDGDKNRIHQAKSVQLTLGVYSGELQLSDFPVLGEWTIEVDMMNKTFDKTFEVAEYVLPKFDVSIETARHAVYKDGKISAIIRAKYNFGKPIKGEATISIYPQFFGSIQPFVYDLITRKVVPIDGKASVEFDIKNELNFKEDYQRDIMIEAIVEEDSNGRKQNITTTVTIHKDKYMIETVKIPKTFIPNVPFEVIAKVIQHDGSPVLDSTNPLMSHVAKGLSGDNTNKTEHKLDSSGMVKMVFTLPDDSTDSYSINVEYLNVFSSLGLISRRRHSKGKMLQIEVLTAKPTINNEVEVSVRANQPMKYFMYQVLGRGDVLMSNVVEVPNIDRMVFRFLATSGMVPRAKLFIYYIDDGDLIFDEHIIYLGEDLGNFVRIEAPSKTTPDQDVDITITTKPNSYVGLMAVDQNSLAMKTGNDITHAMISKELMSHESMTPQAEALIGYPGQEAGVITLTNSNYMVEKAITTSSTTIYREPVTESADTFKDTTVKKTDIGPAHKFESNTKPPLAGPYAFSRIPKPFWNRPRVHVMHDIMDTWLFMNISSGTEGRTTIHRKAPDTQSSWVIKAFSLDPVTGLGLSSSPRHTQTLQQFFITTDLPYSIKAGEVLSVTVVVFNYLERSMDADVTLYNTAQEFEFVDVNNEISETTPKIKLYLKKSVNVATNTAKTLAFMIRPKKTGRITIKLTVNSPLGGDTVEKILRVEPPGVTEYVNKGYLMDLRASSEQTENITIEIPRNAIEDSVHIEVSVVGDLLGPAIKNLDKLIQLPHGCGEQNMITFIPNVLILRHLEKSNKLTPAVEIKAKKFLDLGYQRQLTYRHKDGSFSAFGSSDNNGSVWLTAYVARFFRMAAPYTQIDEEIIKQALEFLAKNQAANGSFVEVGTVLERQHAANMDKGVALTAFTLLAFLENANQVPKYRNLISKAMDYIIRNANVSGDVYSFAVATYALQVADHNAKGTFIQNLDSRATTDADKKWWNEVIPDSEKRSPWYSKPRTLNIEISGYALAAYLEAGLVTDSLPVLKWLISQMNNHGGFESSLDTVVGLMALIKFAEKISFEDTNVQAVFSYGNGAETRINVNEGNAIVLQTYMLPASVRNITVTASGRGVALAQISYRYNVNVTGAWPRFSLDPQVNRMSHSEFLHLSICTSFVPAVGGKNESNMAVMEVSFPSGFTVDLDTLPSLEAAKRVKKVETKMSDTVVVIYFDSLDRNEICPTLDAFKTHKVANQKPASVIIYDYYDNVHKARMFYSAPRATLCDICEGKDCGNSCAERAETRQSLKEDGSDGSTVRGRESSSIWIAPSVAITVLSIMTIRLF